MNMRKIFLGLLFLLAVLYGQSQSFQIAVAKYRGGGDWYANLKTSLPNLIEFTNRELDLTIDPEQAIIEVGSPKIFEYPFVHMTGHGNIILNSQEANNLRNYMLGGGFLHIDDNYGMDPYIRREIKKVFPEKEFVPLPASHPIYHQHFELTEGVPKVHEHDGKPPQAFGIFHEGRLACYYTFESDLGDGWENPTVHNDPPQIHREALKMGANILQFAFLNVTNDEQQEQ